MTDASLTLANEIDAAPHRVVPATITIEDE